jgi:xylan 1,4-beta-xylosidase
MLLVLAAVAGAETRNVSVDASHVTGKIRSFQGVNCGPSPLMSPLPDVGRQYRDLKIDMVRVHDFFGPGDIDARWVEPLDPISRSVKADGAKSIFPNWDADPEKESSYHFEPTDRVIGAIVASGAEVYFRLGRSWGADAKPPADPAKFANICKHVAMHYNGGWAHGYDYKIRYWEVWNEPDVKVEWAPNFIRPFWTGTPQQFYELYKQVARALKEYDPSLRVGGPAKAAPELADGYREAFLQYCAAERLPLDFYSWHLYQSNRTPDPYYLVETARKMRGMLDAGGFGKAESILSEWNMKADPNAAAPDGMQNVAFIGTAMAYLQDAPLDRALYYRGDPTRTGLFDSSGRYRKKGQVFKMLGGFQSTPERLEVTGADTRGLAVLAGRKADGRAVQVLIAHYGTEPVEYKLSVTNLPWGEGEFEVQRYRITGEPDPGAGQAETARGGKLELSGTLPGYGVELTVLRRK